MEALLLTALLTLGLAAARAAPRSDVSPTGAIAMWLAALALRATATVAAALLVIAYVPETAAFESIKTWCLTAAVPFANSDLSVGAHGIADYALLAPVTLLILSLGSVALTGVKAAGALARWVRKTTVSRREDGSFVVADERPLLASWGLRRPRILVSAGAIAVLERDELEAGVAHEHGHRHRRHGLIAAAGLGLYALARPIPGTGRVHDELHFWMERDADEYAAQATGDRLALASAICKVAKAGSDGSGASSTLALAGRSAVPERLSALLDPPAQPPDAARRRVAAITFVQVSAAVAILPLLTAASPIAAFSTLVAHAPALAFCI